MNLEKYSYISELYDIEHRNDSNIHIGYDYQNNILKNTLSKQLFKNNNTNTFILKLQDMVALMFQSKVILRNWFNYTVNKYYDKHNN
jgi:hypothetical protein